VLLQEPGQALDDPVESLALAHPADRNQHLGIGRDAQCLPRPCLGHGMELVEIDAVADQH
jgi:hypothetical protein